MWTSFRIPKKRKLDLESDPYLYEKSGEYNLSVKIIDIFGTELVNSYKIRI
jgi:hypothetical protein